MRQHPNLETMLQKETDNPTPRAAASLLKNTAPAGTTDAVLYANRQKGEWIVLFIPQSFPTVTQAGRHKANGKTPIASCPIPPPIQEDQG